MDRNLLNARACLWALMILHAVMLGALFTKTVPHPPAEIPLFALGPFFGAVLAIGGFALIQFREETASGYVAALLVGAMSLISFGPQKILVPEFGQIWPAVLTGMASAITLMVFVIASWRNKMPSDK